MCLTAYSGVASSIPARSRTFMKIDYGIILRSFSSLPLMHLRRVDVNYKRKDVHELLVNCLFKLAQEKVWLCELSPSHHDHSCRLGGKATKQTKLPPAGLKTFRRDQQGIQFSLLGRTNFTYKSVY